MIEKEYAKAILNILMAKPINEGGANEDGNDPALVERAKLKDDGVTLYVAPTASSLGTTATNDQKKIDNSTHWQTISITATSTDGKKLVGYKTVRKFSDTNKMYPTKRYLALLTEMPESDGSDFEELRISHEIKDGETIYCDRINLNTGYFSNDLIMKAAEQNTAKITPGDDDSDIIGGAITLNDVVIYFPEITKNNWGGADDKGPALWGFGIFENAKPVEGEKPYLWGKLSNEDAIAKLAHVPLFRKEKFQFSIK